MMTLVTRGMGLALAFAGNRLTPSIDGTSFGSYFDDGYAGGRVGIDVISTDDGQFDDMDIVQNASTGP